ILNYSPNTIYETLQAKYQDFSISPTADTIITCKQETLLGINARIFNTTDTLSELNIKVQEFYKKADFVTSNMTTRTNKGEILESRGMINIEVYQKGERLQIKENQQFD